MNLSLIQWLEQHQQPCVIKQHLGIPCPGCGMQRAIIEILKGNIIESISVYPALLPLAGMILFLGAHLIWKFNFGAIILKIFFYFNGLLIVLSYFNKLFM